MPKSVMPSDVIKSAKKKKPKDLAVLAKTPRPKRFFLAKLSSSNAKAVALTRAPENENQDISLETTFTLSLAGHADMFLFRCFCL